MSVTTVDRQWYDEIPRSARAPTLFGVALLVFVVGGFGVWAGTAPIAGAVVANGVFVATGQNKTIQHLEGGVIREIAVREGDVVTPKQTLLVLDDTTPKAELRRLTLRMYRLDAMEARLRAEAEGREAVSFPSHITADAGDPQVASIIDSQRLSFEARRRTVQSEVAALQDTINGLQQRVDGTQVQLTGVRRQLTFIGEELEGKAQLLKSGLIRKPEVLALQRIDANLHGEIGRLSGELGDAQERIARTREQITATKSAAVKAAVEQLHEVRAEANDVGERILAARGVLERVRITAPVQGIVVKMRYNTSGGVVEAGKPILELLPVDEQLVIEARVRPQDIDHVKRGQEAVVRLTALNRRMTPMIAAEVMYLSADALPDDKRGQQAASDVYVVRVRLDPVDAARIESFHPTPGMPAEIYIKTRERTFFDYLTQPVRDSMSRSFREW